MWLLHIPLTQGGVSHRVGARPQEWAQTTETRGTQGPARDTKNSQRQPGRHYIWQRSNGCEGRRGAGVFSGLRAPGGDKVGRKGWGWPVLPTRRGCPESAPHSFLCRFLWTRTRAATTSHPGVQPASWRRQEGGSWG